MRLFTLPDGDFAAPERTAILTVPFDLDFSGTPTPPTNGNLLEAVIAYLKTVSSLSSLTEIYANKARKPAYPFMVISSNLDAIPEVNTSADYWETQPYQFSVFSRDDTEANTLARAAYAALMPKGNAKLTFDDGYEMAKFPGRLRGPFEQPGQQPGQLAVWSSVFTVNFLVGRTMGV